MTRGNRKDMEDLAREISKVKRSDGSPWFDVRLVKSGHYKVKNLVDGTTCGFAHTPNVPSEALARSVLKKVVGYYKGMGEEAQKMKVSGASSDSVSARADLVFPELEKLMTPEAAKEVWKYLRFFKVGGQSKYRNGVLGYHWAGRLPQVMCEMWPQLEQLSSQDLRLVTNRMSNYMRGRGVDTVVGGNPAQESVYHVFDSWNGAKARTRGSVLALSGVGAGKEVVKDVESGSTESGQSDSVGGASVPTPLTEPKVAEVVEDGAEVLFAAALELQELREYRKKVEALIRKGFGMASEMTKLSEELKSTLEELEGK